MHSVVANILKEVDFNTVSNVSVAIHIQFECFKFSQFIYFLYFVYLLLQATLSDILRQLGMIFFLIISSFRSNDFLSYVFRKLIFTGTHFGLDLMHRKAEVKNIITDVISSMSDEEVDDEEVDDEEAENDEDGDGDGDGDGGVDEGGDASDEDDNE